MTTTHINQNVTVSSIGFGRGGSAYPRRMEFGGCTYNFVDAGIKTVVRKGERRIADIFTVSDGQREFSLRKAAGSWTLLAIHG